MDGHEKEATIAYRYNFIERYFTNERRAPRWIQITEEEAYKLEEESDIPKGSGFHYNHPETGVPMVEYHVDTSDSFQKRMGEESWLGGRRSVRYPDGKLLITWGHDEMIMKQYLLTKKTWNGPSGEIGIVPKDEGMGIMISAFQFREFGFGLAISQEQLEEINKYCEGKRYLDEDAATLKRGSPTKKLLTSSPFVVEFNYGAQYEGYWCYEHMVLQLKDCIDCLHVLHPEFDYLFLFDHSCGHD